MTTQKRASIVIVGLPWNDERLRNGPFDPLKIKEGIETIDKLMKEHGFGESYVNVQYACSSLLPLKKGLNADEYIEQATRLDLVSSRMRSRRGEGMRCFLVED